MSTMVDALNRLCKWRMILAGWQLGTRPKGDPECEAVRDQREVLLLLRVEVNALTQLLIDRGIFTPEEFRDHLEVEAGLLERQLEQQFPGAKATDYGIELDATVATGWLAKFRL
jgi:hypothetical protein